MRWTPPGSLQKGAQGDKRGHQQTQQAQDATKCSTPEPHSPPQIQKEVRVKLLGMFSRKAPLTIGHRGQLQHCVKGTFQVGHFICRESKAGELPHPLSKSRLRHASSATGKAWSVHHQRDARSRPCMDLNTSHLLRAHLSSLLQQDQSSPRGWGAHLHSCPESMPGGSA